MVVEKVPRPSLVFFVVVMAEQAAHAEISVKDRQVRCATTYVLPLHQNVTWDSVDGGVKNPSSHQQCAETPTHHAEDFRMPGDRRFFCDRPGGECACLGRCTIYLTSSTLVLWLCITSMSCESLETASVATCCKCSPIAEDTQTCVCVWLIRRKLS